MGEKNKIKNYREIGYEEEEIETLESKDFQEQESHLEENEWSLTIMNCNTCKRANII